MNRLEFAWQVLMLASGLASVIGLVYCLGQLMFGAAA